MAEFCIRSSVSKIYNIGKVDHGPETSSLKYQHMLKGEDPKQLHSTPNVAQ